MRRSTPGLDSVLLWLGLLFAFSPGLVTLASRLTDSASDRVALLAPLLLLLGLGAAGSARAEPRSWGALAIATGAAIEVLGLSVGSGFITVMGLPIAAVGLAGWRGHPPIVLTALLFFALPLPGSVVSLASPELETSLTRVAGAILGNLGLSVEARGVALVAPAGRINLDPTDGGAMLAVVLAALGWYSAARLGAGIRTAASRAALSCLLAIPLQSLAVLVAGLLLAADLVGVGRLWLSHGAWITTSVVGLAWLHRPSARGSDRRDDPR